MAICLARKTFPNAPDPSVFTISNEAKQILLSVTRELNDSMMDFLSSIVDFSPIELSLLGSGGYGAI